MRATDACRSWLASAATVLMMLAAHASMAQVVTPFGARYTTNVAGESTYIGNSLQTCPTSASGCAAARLGTATPIGNNNNNNFSMVHIDVDSDATTFNSSRAALALPAGANVLFAGLYWGADLSAGSGGVAAVNATQANSVLFQVPGGGNYQTISGSRIGTSGSNYASFANVTAQVAAAGNGAYTVANVQAGTGGNRYAGWTLVLVYQSPGSPPRNLTVFDGYANVSSSATVTIPISGFTAPLAGPVNAQVGAIAFEGDIGLVGDRLRLNGNDLGNSLNPADNFFNSTFTLLGSRFAAKTPDYPNLMAVDADLLNTTNLIANGATGATVTLSTSGDTYFPIAVTTAIDLYAPNVSANKSANDLNGGQLVPGDVIEYTITVSNSGQDPAANVVLSDPIPAGTSYVPGSLRVVSGANAGTKTDAAGDDQAEYVPAGNLVRFRLGTGATATTGGTLTTSGANATSTIRFRVQVDANAGDTQLIRNQAQLSYNAATIGTPLTGATNESALPVATPVLALDKTAAPNPVLAGAELTYTLNFANNGTAPASAVTLSDSLPANTSFVSASGGGSFDAGSNTVVWNLGTLAAGASGSVSLRVLVSSPLPNGSIIGNSASLSAANATPVTAGTDITVASAPFLVIEKTASETVVGGGDKILYTISFRNAGSDVASAVRITDLVPAHTSFVLASGGGVHDPGSNAVTWELGDLPAGSSGSVNLSVQVNTPTPNGALITNTATISASNAPDASASATSTASTEPVLILEKTGQPNPVQAGATLAYTLSFRNIGTDIANNVVLTDPLPANSTFLSASGGGSFDPTSNTVTWQFPSLGVEVAGSVTLSVRVATPLPNGTWINNSATIGSDQTAPVSAGAQTLVASQAQLSLSKSASSAVVPAGGEVVFTLDYANAGNDQASNALLIDALPANTSFVGASAGGSFDPIANRVTWNLGNIAAGTGGSVALTLRVATPLANGTVIHNSGSLEANGLPPLSAGSSVTVSSAPALVLSKSAAPDPVAAGELLTYTLAYANNGSDSATAVALNDPLPLNTSFVSASAGGSFDPGSNAVNWTLGTIPAGSTGSVSLVVAVNSPLDDGTRLSNAASLSSAELPPVSASVQSTVHSQPVLGISKTAAPSPVVAGAGLDYAVTVNNTGNANATGVVITDALPAEVDFVAASDGGTYDPDSHTVSWTLPMLAAGSSREFSLQVTVFSPLPNGSLLVNQATIGSDQTVPVSTSLGTPVASSPVLTLSKTDDVDPVEAGAALVYTLSYGNTGNDSAANTMLTDVLPGNVLFVSASDGGTYDASSRTVTWSLGSLAAGATGTVTLSVQVGAPLANGTQLLNNAAINADNAQPTAASAVTTVNSHPVMTLTKQADNEQVSPGATVNYTLSYANTGNDQATALVLTDTLAANTSFVSASNGGSYEAGSNTVTWNLGDLAAGAAGTVTVTVTVASPLPDGTPLINSATANADNAQPVSASVTVQVNSQPVLTLTKSVDQPTSAPGQTLNFTISYGNTGDDSAFDVVLVDPLPPGTTFVSASAGGSHDPATGTVTWTLGTLAAGASGSVTVSVQLPTPMPDGSVVVNNATVSAANGVPATAQASSLVGSSPVLTLAKTASQDPIPAGGQLVYTLVVGNTGDDDAHELAITDVLPANTSFVAASDGGSFDSGSNTVTWTFESLPAGASRSLTLTVQIASPLANGTMISNSATASAGNAAPVTGGVDVTVASAPVLTLAKAASADPVQPGQTLTYTLTYGNGGDDAAANVVLIDAIPANTSFVSVTGGGVYDAGSNTVTWNLGAVAAGASGSVSLTVTVETPLADGTVIANTAVLAADNGSPVEAGVGVVVDSDPSLVLTKVASQNPVTAGATFDFSLAYANVGDDVAASAVLSDPLPPNTSFIAATGGGLYDAASNSVTWALGDIPAGAGGTVVLTLQVASPLANGTPIQNTAQLIAANSTPANASAVVTVDSNPSLSLSKAALTDPVAPGAELGFVLSYANNGTDVASNASISDPLPANTSFVSASDGGSFDAGSNTVTWALGNLAAGATGTRTLVLAVASPLADGTPIVNTATLGADGVNPVSASAVSTVSSAGVLTLTKTASADPVQPGQSLTYTLAYANTGNDAAANATISDPLPAGTLFVSASNGGSYDPVANRIDWSLGTLPAGTSGSVTLTVEIASPLANGKTIVNTATLAADGLPSTSASVVVTVVVDDEPLLALTKTASHDPVAPGDTMVYTLVYGNIGTGTATGVSLADAIPAGTSFVAASDGGSHDPGSDTVTWNLGDIGAGASGSVTLTVQVDSPLADGTVIANSATASGDNVAPVNAGVDVVVDSNAALTLSKIASQSPVGAGDTVVFTLGYVNSGTDVAVGVVLVDPLPVNTSFVSASHGGSYDAGSNTVTWPLGDLPANAGGSVSLTVQAASPLANGTLITNTAQLSATNTTPANAAAVVIVDSSPQLLLAKTASSDTVSPGDQLGYAIAYNNIGTDTADNAVIIDTLPADTSFVSASDGGIHDPGSNTVTWNLGDLAAGASGSRSLLLEVDSPLPDGTLIANTASLVADGIAPVTATAVTTVTVAPGDSALTLVKTASHDPVGPADTLVYSLVYGNTGPGTALDAQLIDVVPAGTSFVSATGGGVHDPASNTVTWMLGSIPPGSGGSLSLAVAVDDSLADGTVISNSASLSAGNAPPVQSGVDVTVAGATILSLAKTTPVSTVAPGDSFDFHIAYDNIGSVVASNARIEDQLPAGTEFVSASDGGSYDATSNTVTWLFGSLAPGGGDSVTLTLSIPATTPGGTVITNTASLSADGIDPTLSAASLVVASDSGSAVLGLLKTANPSPVVAGAALTYTLSYSVSGSVTATGVTLIDALPDQVSFLSASAGGSHDPASNTVSWALGDLPPGSTGSVTLQVLVMAGTPAGTTLGNTAQLQGANAAVVTANVQTPVSGSGQPPDVRPVPSLSLWSLLLLVFALVAVAGQRLRRRVRG